MQEKRASGHTVPLLLIVLFFLLHYLFASKMPVDHTNASRITISKKLAYRYGDRPFFPEAVVGCFVRVKYSPTSYRWTRIEEVIVCEPFQWGRKHFDYQLKCELIPEVVDLKCLSDSPPDATEIDYYRVHGGALTSADATTADPLYAYTDEDIGKIEAKLAKLIQRDLHLSLADAKCIIEHNSRIKACSVNLASESLALSHALPSAFEEEEQPSHVRGDGDGMMAFSSPGLRDPTTGGADDSFMSPTAVSRGGGTTAARWSTGADGSATRYTPRLTIALNDSQASMQRESTSQLLDATQQMLVLDESGELVTSPLAAAGMTSRQQQELDRLKTRNTTFTNFVTDEERAREQTLLVGLTERNRAKNKIQVLEASDAFAALPRVGKLAEARLLWEVDKTKRMVLCDEYDEEAEGRKEAAANAKPAGGQKVPNTTTATPTSDENVAIETMHAQRLRTLRGDDISDAVLEEAKRTVDRMSKSGSRSAASVEAPFQGSSSPLLPSRSLSSQNLALRLRTASSPANVLGAKRQRDSMEVIGSPQ